MSPVVPTSDPPLAPPPDPATSVAQAASTLTRELDIVEEWGVGSFPASDPPANW